MNLLETNKMKIKNLNCDCFDCSEKKEMIKDWQTDHDQLIKDKQELIEMYKECLEKFVPLEKYDEVQLFLSLYNSPLGKKLHENEIK